jgi:hypothetical protein
MSASELGRRGCTGPKHGNTVASVQKGIQIKVKRVTVL